MMNTSSIDSRLLEDARTRIDQIQAGLNIESNEDEALFRRLSADEDLAIQAPSLSERCQTVLGYLEKGLMVPGDYAGLLEEITQFDAKAVVTGNRKANDRLMLEVAEQILAKAGNGTGDVTLKASDLAAWGNTLQRALKA